MDMDTAILLRFIERLIGMLIGGLSIYLGYRLFLKIPDQREGEGRINFKDLSIIMSRIGPGVFFALFGASVVGMSIYKGVIVESSGDRFVGSTMATAPKADAGITANAPAHPTERFSGMGASTTQADANKRADVRALLKRDIATLNTLLAKLHPDLPVQDRSPVEFAIPRIKFALMKAYWPENEAGWGDPERFEAWLDAGEPQPSPPEIAAAIAYFYTAAPRVKP